MTKWFEGSKEILDEKKRLSVRFMISLMNHSDEVDIRIIHNFSAVIPLLSNDGLKKIGYDIIDELERRKIPWFEKLGR